MESTLSWQLTTFQTIIQRFYFANNKINGPNDKAVKVCLLLDRFDLVLSASLGDNKSQRINDYVCILKWRSSIEQSIKTKLIK